MSGGDSRVFVTGLGVVSTVGDSVEAFWDACQAGCTAVASIPAHWDTYYKATSRVWSPLPPLDFARYGIGRTDQLTIPIPAQLALAAAAQATAQAGLSERFPSSRASDDRDASLQAGIFVGTGLGAAAAPFDNHYAHVMSGLREGLRRLADAAPDDEVYAERLAALKAGPRVNPLVICQTMPNAIAAHLAIRHGFRGVAETSCAACAAGTIAIGKAFRALRRGELDVALAGGAEHLGDRAGSVFMGFDRLQTLARPYRELGTENRPFDRHRSGFLFSEGGAAFAVLESERSVIMRDVKPLAEIVGYGETVDACSIAAIRADDNAIRTMIERALNDAGIPAADIDYVNAHGTATEMNDAIEADILAETFRSDVLVGSTKSILGHTIGAAGALEFVVTVLSLVRQRVHGCVNLDEPIADLNFCRRSEDARLTYALTHSFGFGGHNAGLILRRLQD
ncbi:MAG: beta-ketoacyl synthase [Parvibaculaceae bacterium]